MPRVAVPIGTQIVLPKAEYEALVALNNKYGKGDIDRVPTYDPFTGIGYVDLRITSATARARFTVSRDGSRVTIRYRGHQKTIKP
jgi:hypothetical protein